MPTANSKSFVSAYKFSINCNILRCFVFFCCERCQFVAACLLLRASYLTTISSSTSLYTQSFNLTSAVTLKR